MNNKAIKCSNTKIVRRYGTLRYLLYGTYDVHCLSQWIPVRELKKPKDGYIDDCLNE